MIAQGKVIAKEAGIAPEEGQVTKRGAPSMDFYEFIVEQFNKIKDYEKEMPAAKSPKTKKEIKNRISSLKSKVYEKISLRVEKLKLALHLRIC